MNSSRRTRAAVIAAGLLLVSCGAGSTTDSGAAPATEPAAAPTAAPAVDDGATNAGNVTATAPVESDVVPAGDEPASVNPGSSDPTATDEVPATEAAAPAPADAVLGGRAFAADLSAESDFAENVLPDLQVDDIRSGQKANLRNVFPAERPVLFWMWAPH